MLILAETYYLGWLVRRDFDAAVRWWRRAAREGSAAARGMLVDTDVVPAVETTRA